MEINWENFEIAKQLIGKKAILLGGGQLMNAFIIVKVLSVNKETGQAEVNENGKIMHPFMYSYYLRPIAEELEWLSIGDYLVSMSNEPEIRKQNCGLFGTIYDCTMVAKYIENKWIEVK